MAGGDRPHDGVAVEELQTAGGSVPRFPPYTNKPEALAKLALFLCLLPTNPPALGKKICSRVSRAQSVLRASLCPHPDQEPH